MTDNKVFSPPCSKLPDQVLSFIAEDLRRNNDFATLSSLSLCSRAFNGVIRGILYPKLVLDRGNTCTLVRGPHGSMNGQSAPDISSRCLHQAFGTLVVNTFPDSKHLLALQQLTRSLGRDVVYPNVHTIEITYNAMVELFLRSPKDLAELFKGIARLTYLATPKQVYLYSIDNLKKPKGAKVVTAFDIIDNLTEAWLDEGVSEIISTGPYHRARPFLYNDTASDLTHRLVWTHLTTPILKWEKSTDGRIKDAEFWSQASLLKDTDGETKWVNYIADQAFPHVFAVITQQLRKPTAVRLEILCPDMSRSGMRKVRERIGEEIGMSVGGKADGMIEGHGRLGSSRKKPCVRIV
jgi:hypothetical protein